MAAELTLNVTQIGSGDVASNTSRVRIDLSITTTLGTWSHDGTTEGYIRLDGAQVADLSGKWVDINTTTQLYSGEHTVTHNADGTKTVAVEAGFNMNTTYTGWTYATKALVLTTIPRASTMTVPTFTLGTEGTITVKKAHNDFSHTITYTFGTESANVCEKAKSTTVKWTPDPTLANEIPNATSGTGTLKITTYNGSAKVGSTKSYTFTAKVPSGVVPKISAVAVSPVNSDGKFKDWGVYIKGKTKIQYTITASGDYGSSVNSHNFSCAGLSVSGNGGTSITGTTAVISANAGSYTPTATVGDTRKRKSASKSGSKITVYDYSVPSISSSYAKRTEDGSTSIVVFCKATHSSVGGKNTLTVRYRSRPSGGSWSSYKTLTNGTETTASGFAINTSYEVEVSAVDTVGNVNKVVYTVPTEEITFMLKDGGKSASFGKYPESNGLDMGWPIYMNGNKIVELADPTAATDAANKAYVDSVADSVPLHDAFKTSGVFNGDYNTAQTDPNFKYWGTWWTQPSGGACANYPEGATYGFLTTKKTNNIPTQIYTQYSNGKTWERSYVNNQWHGWFRQDGLDCAPSGFIHEVFTPITTNEAITDALNATIADMPDKTMRYIRLVIGAGSLWLTQTSWVVLLYKHSASYGFAIATAYGSESPVQAFNSFYNGEWKGFGFINPTANAGTAYRTAERHRGKPVYTKVLSYGTTANQKAVDTGLAVSKYLILRYAGTLNGTPLPYHYTDTSEDAWFRVYAGATNYGSMLHIPAADAGLSNTFLQIWYCEK